MRSPRTAVAARRASAARQHQVEQAQRESAQRAQAVRAQIEAERGLAAAQVQPVFDPGWWEAAEPADVADMWQHANSWREPDSPVSTPTIFDYAAGRIGQELRDRTAEATHTPATAAPRPRPAAARSAGRELHRQRLTCPGAGEADPWIEPSPSQATGPRGSRDLGRVCVAFFGERSFDVFVR